MKKTTAIALVVALASVSAHAQSSQSNVSTDTSSSSLANSANSGQGNGNNLTLNSAPSPDHITETVRNVSAGALGAFASSLNAFDCHFTGGGGNIAVPGFSGTFQWSKNDPDFCVKGWAQAELNRQSTITEDPAVKARLQQASTNVKCSLDDAIYQAMVAAGLTCQTKPQDYDKRNPPVVTNTDGQRVQTALVYLKAQP